MGVYAKFVLLGVAVATFSGAEKARADNYHYTDITVSNATTLNLSAMNDRGQVVGSASVPGGSPPYQAFIWDGGVGTLVPGSAQFQSVNDKGLTAGYPEYPNQNTVNGQYVTYDSTTGATVTHKIALKAPIDVIHLAPNGEIFAQELKYGVHQHGRVVPFSYKKKIRKYHLAGESSLLLRDANDAGDLVVQCNSAKKCSYDLYSNGSFTPIDVPGSTKTVPTNIMENGQVVGGTLLGAGEVAFVETDGSYVTYAGPVPGVAGAIGALPSGEVFGVYAAGKNTNGFAFLNGKYYILAVPGAVSTQLAAVNAKGDLLGTWYDAQATAHPFYAKCAEGKFCTAIKN